MLAVIGFSGRKLQVPDLQLLLLCYHGAGWRSTWELDP